MSASGFFFTKWWSAQYERSVEIVLAAASGSNTLYGDRPMEMDRLQALTFATLVLPKPMPRCGQPPQLVDKFRTLPVPMRDFLRAARARRPRAAAFSHFVGQAAGRLVIVGELD